MTKQAESIQVIDRIVVLFDLLARQTQGQSLKQLAIDSNLATSTVFRLLASLKQHGLVEQSKNNLYFLGKKLLRYTKNLSDDDDFRHTIQPTMEKLNQHTEETINLSIQDGPELVYIDRILSPKVLRADVTLGKRTPLHATAAGKLILGAMTNSAFNAYIAQAHLYPYTKHTLTCADKLRQHCLDAYAQDYATEYEEAELGLGCIAVLIHHNQNNYGLSISAPVERLDNDWFKILRATLKKIELS